VQYLGLAPLNDDGTHLASMNRGQPVMVAGTPPAAPSRPAPKQPEPIAVAAASPGGGGDEAGFYVQVGSFSDPSNAGRAEARLAALGPVVTTPVDVDRGRFYRVRVGPLQDQASAHAALARIQAAGHHDARVVVAQN